jgi:hypothetical protein
MIPLRRFCVRVSGQAPFFKARLAARWEQQEVQHMAEPKTYSGGCHCGRVRFEADVDLGKVMSCNCSICTQKGFLWSFLQPSQFRLQSGGEDLTEYQFNKHVVHHLFCPTCGAESFARGKGQDGSDVIALNVRSLSGIDIGALLPTPFDGRSR